MKRVRLKTFLTGRWAFFAFIAAALISAAGALIYREIPRRTLAGLLGIEPPYAWEQTQLLKKEEGGLPLAPLVLPENNVTVETLQLSVDSGATTAYFLLPEFPAPGSKKPAVLFLHGHLTQAADFAGLTKSPFVWPAAALLARHGYIVLVPQIRWETSDLQEETRQAMPMLLNGKTLMGERVADVLRCVEFLCAHPQVDCRRIGLLGWSMGGQLALYGAALDRRVSAVYASSAFASLEMLLEPEAPLQSPDNYVPSLLKRFGDKDKVASLIKPRPILIEQGLIDRVEPFQWVQHSAQGLNAFYGRRKDRLYFVSHRFGHQFYGAEVLDWFDKWLGESR